MFRTAKCGCEVSLHVGVYGEIESDADVDVSDVEIETPCATHGLTMEAALTNAKAFCPNCEHPWLRHQSEGGCSAWVPENMLRGAGQMACPCRQAG